MTVQVDAASAGAIAGFAIGNSATGGLGQGIRVERAAALPPASGASEDLFSVDGGPVMITGILGEVTAALPAASIDLALNHDPDGGGSNVALATALVCDSDPVGTFYVLNDTAGGALVQSTDQVLNAALEEPFVVGAGDVLLTTSGGGAIGTTARVRWTLWYVPLLTGAVVTAV